MLVLQREGRATAAIRRTVLDRDKGACRLCGGRAEQVHHRTYTRSGLKGSNLGQLAALCRDCHRQVEVSPGGVKRDLREAEAEYRRLEGERARTLKGCLLLEYLIRRQGTPHYPGVAHLWVVEDTLCGAVKTGGLALGSWSSWKVVTNHDLDLCLFCAVLHEKAEAAYLASLAPLARPCPRREHSGG